MYYFLKVIGQNWVYCVKKELGSGFDGCKFMFNLCKDLVKNL